MIITFQLQNEQCRYFSIGLSVEGCVNYTWPQMTCMINYDTYEKKCEYPDLEVCYFFKSTKSALKVESKIKQVSSSSKGLSDIDTVAKWQHFFFLLAAVYLWRHKSVTWYWPDLTWPKNKSGFILLACMCCQEGQVSALCRKLSLASCTSGLSFIWENNFSQTLSKVGIPYSVSSCTISLEISDARFNGIIGVSKW